MMNDLKKEIGLLPFAINDKDQVDIYIQKIIENVIFLLID